MTDRDPQLAAALSELEVPEHAPDFFARLRERLEAEAPALPAPALPAPVPFRQAPRRRWKRNALRVAVVGAAAGVLGVALAGGLGTPGGRSPFQPRTATAAEVVRTAQRAVAGVETLRGTVTVRAVDRPGQPPSELRWTFVTTSRGDFRLTGTSRPEDLAYDAGTGVERSWVTEPGGETYAGERRGVALGWPDQGPASWVLQREVSATLRALVAAEDPAVREATYDGRPAWVLETAVRPNQLSDLSGDHLEVTVDQRSGLPVRIVESKAGTLLRETTLGDLVVDAPVAPGSFTVTPPPGTRVAVTDAGWRPAGLADAAAVVGYRPLVPSVVPEGYALAQVVVAREAGPTGVEAMNPPTRSAVQIAYRRGLDVALVTMRLRDVPGGLPDDLVARCRECLAGSRWSDPLASGEGFVDNPEPLTIRAGALAGAPGQLLVDPRTTPHVWALGTELVVTVSGDLSRAELTAMVESLAPYA